LIVVVEDTPIPLRARLLTDWGVSETSDSGALHEQTLSLLRSADLQARAFAKIDDPLPQTEIVQIRTLPDTTIIEITAQHTSPEQASTYINALIDELIATQSDMNEVGGHSFENLPPNSMSLRKKSVPVKTLGRQKNCLASMLSSLVPPKNTPPSI